MAWMVMAHYFDESTGLDVSKPRFPVASGKAEADALCERLNRVAREQWMYMNLQNVRRASPTVHAQWRNAAIAVMQSLDSQATTDVRYTVEEVGAPFSEPPTPTPANAQEAYFYELRDGNYPAPPPPEE